MTVWEIELVCEATEPIANDAICTTVEKVMGGIVKVRAQEQELRVYFDVPSTECSEAMRAAHLKLRRLGFAVRAYLINVARPPVRYTFDAGAALPGPAAQ